MRNITKISTQLGKSALGWKTKKSSLGVTKNWILGSLAARLPGDTKIWFYKKMGIKIGKHVQIMPDVRMEIFFPELIKIGDNVVVGQEAFFACHEFNVNEFRYGPIDVGNNVLIGARTFILPGVKIGNNAIIAANTTVYQDVPNNVIAFGSPLKFKKFKKK
ncbi:MAG: acyltransferase [Candidatus Diapherotrites archaeon]|jgi:acetyltransferase-like isoleucine patch superfamily enzyme|nr:acyltransferase [Candidatus Diapherotrites archaeon]MBT4596530.1 acyltransferase [Candidatus Diapherotrites archaeon]